MLNTVRKRRISCFPLQPPLQSDFGGALDFLRTSSIARYLPASLRLPLALSCHRILGAPANLVGYVLHRSQNGQRTNLKGSHFYRVHREREKRNKKIPETPDASKLRVENRASVLGRRVQGLPGYCHTWRAGGYVHPVVEPILLFEAKRTPQCRLPHGIYDECLRSILGLLPPQQLLQSEPVLE